MYWVERAISTIKLKLAGEAASPTPSKGVKDKAKPKKVSLRGWIYQKHPPTTLKPIGTKNEDGNVIQRYAMVEPDPEDETWWRI
jgi:hypothetical protein